jgi:hypothetical protein
LKVTLTKNEGSNCGSSYANQAVKSEVIKRLKSAGCKSLKGPSFEYIIEHDVMNHFEYFMKRNFDPADGLDGDDSIVVHGLTKDSKRRFGDSTMYFTRFVHISADQTRAILTYPLPYGSHAELSPQKGNTGIFRPQLEGNKQTHPTANKCRQRNRPHGVGKPHLIPEFPI